MNGPIASHPHVFGLGKGLSVVCAAVSGLGGEVTVYIATLGARPSRPQRLLCAHSELILALCCDTRADSRWNFMKAQAPPPPPLIKDRSLINGRPSTIPLLHQSIADAAEAYIHLRQTYTCTNETKLLFARFDTHGIGNDINLAVRALATAMIQERQVIFLPPTQQERKETQWLQDMQLDAERPWHWLAGAGMPLSSLIVESACQKAFAADGRGLLRLLADANETDPTSKLVKMGLTGMAKRSRCWKPIWRVGLHSGVIPAPFRSQGLLWWFQALTNYLIRIRAPLSFAIDRHPAMRAFLRPGGPAELGCPPMANVNKTGPARRTVAKTVLAGQIAPAAIRDPCHRAPPETGDAFGRLWCKKRWCDYIGPGWHPPVWFDVGLHLRLGDVCGRHAPTRGKKARRCSDQPTQEAFELMRAHGLRGRVFMASDSHEAVETAVALGPSYGFNVSSLSFNRANIEGVDLEHNRSVGTEGVRRTRTRDMSVLVETLMDVLLLSRSTVLVGSMMSNFPRMALQLRQQAPLHHQERYLALDGRTWCTRTSCRMNYSDMFGTV